MQFEHESHAQRVVFSSGGAAAALGAEVDRFGGRRVMVIADEETSAMAERISAGLPVAVRHSEVAMHVPAPVADRARAVAAEHDVDLLVSVGGGSTTGLAKAIALTSGLPIVAVPTTYAGSEATWVWGLTDGGAKTTGRDVTVLPRSVVYDATLTVSLPVGMSVASGLNAVAHGVDSMWSPDSDPIDRALAEEAIRSLALSTRCWKGTFTSEPGSSTGTTPASTCGTAPRRSTARRRRPRRRWPNRWRRGCGTGSSSR